jgi:hypothetical protein
VSDEPIDSLFKETIGSGLVTHYIIVVEVMTDEGMDLRIATSDNMTAWHAAGMLKVANEMVMDSRYMVDTDEEED